MDNSKNPMPVWARHFEVCRLTGVPERWLYNWGREHPEHTRKFGTGKSTNGALVYRVSAILKAVEEIGKEVK